MVKHCQLSHEMIEKIATSFLEEHAPEHMAGRTPLDLESIIELKLGLSLDFLKLSNNDDILGASAFEETVVFSYGDNYESGVGIGDTAGVPVVVSEGTIILSPGLETPGNEGRRNFTLAHEIGHFVLPNHQEFYLTTQIGEKDYALCSYRQVQGSKQLETELDWFEWQANTFAANILMPRSRIERDVKTFGECLNPETLKSWPLCFPLKWVKQYGVSKTALKNRLQHCGHLPKDLQGNIWCL